MQTNLFSSIFAVKNTAEGAVDTPNAKTSPVELELSVLTQVGGAGPAGTWAVAQGPAGTW